jgi:hypothetical protein
MTTADPQAPGTCKLNHVSLVRAPMTLDPALLLFSIPSGICLAITAIRWRYHLGQGERADAATPVSGVVVADGDEPIVEQVLDLKIPAGRVGMSVEETRRTLHVRPFVVKTDGGELVDVEPGPGLALHATLGDALKLEDQRRYTKTARVDVGERVYLLGQLRAAGSAEEHRRISPSLVSTEPIGSTARRAAANDRKWLVRWAVMSVLGPLPYFVPPVPFFLVAFWIREMIVDPMWWSKRRYREWYGAGSSREDRSEYD